MRESRLIFGIGIVLILAVGTVVFAQEGVKPAADEKTAEKAPATETAPVKASDPEFMKKLGYCIGLQMGMNIRSQKVPVDVDELAAGVKAGFSGAKPKMTQQEVEGVFRVFQDMIMKKMIAETTRKGEEFLAKNKKDEGVTVLASGLQYKVLKQGKGPKPKAGDMVKVHYEGKFIDGQTFDSSYGRGRPMPVKVGSMGIIPGWNEALPLMNKGSKWRLVIPHQLAYGAQGFRNVIPPCATLVFEMEVVEVLEPPKLETVEPEPAPVENSKAPK